MSEIFLLTEEGSLGNIDVSNFLIAGVRATNIVACAAGAVGNQTLFVDFRRQPLDEGDFRSQVVQILHTQLDFRAGFAAAGLQRSAPGKNGDEVSAESFEGNH